MMSAREGEEIVCPRGTICGHATGKSNDHIADGAFAVLEGIVSAGGRRYRSAYCKGAVAVRDYLRWRVQLRRGWVR